MSALHTVQYSYIQGMDKIMEVLDNLLVLAALKEI